jgi:hypothetical protein
MDLRSLYCYPQTVPENRTYIGSFIEINDLLFSVSVNASRVNERLLDCFNAIHDILHLFDTYGIFLDTLSTAFQLSSNTHYFIRSR